MKNNSPLIYQTDFAKHSDVAYDLERRRIKGKKIAAVISHYFNGDVGTLRVIDVGCSTGTLASVLGETFGSVIGVDIDTEAVDFAKKHFQSMNVMFEYGDSLNLDYPAESFDVVVCAHIYEHVPDAAKMMTEIGRVLKPNGICCFVAGNRLELMEPHHHLPLLSVIPRPLGHIYMRLAGKGSYYYEKHLTVWGLRQLVKNFSIVDYTSRVIKDPVTFNAQDVLSPGSMKHRIAKLIDKYFYWLVPDYIWILKKETNSPS